MMTPRVQYGFPTLRIYYGELLHLKLDVSQIMGFQSYIVKGVVPDPDRYIIEYHGTHGQVIETEYVDRTHWELIIRAVEKII